MEIDHLSLKPSDAAKAVASCVERRENVALVGPPGCGKSSIAAQVAQELHRELIVSLPALEDPTEPGGLPWISADHTHAKKVLFAQAYRVLNSTRPVFWWLEDFGQGEPAIQKAYMQWAQAREIDGNRLPDHVSIGMATNRRTDKAGVSGILEPVKGRFTLLHLRSDLDDFCNNLFKRGISEYGLNEEAVTVGAAFLRSSPDLLNKFEPTADMTNSPTERNWVSAFAHTMPGLPVHIEQALIGGRVGAGAAATFSAFLAMLRASKAFNLDAILADPMHALIPENTSAQWAVAIGLAGRATEANFGRVAQYGNRLVEAKLGEFGVLMMRDSVRRNARIGSTRAWIEMASSPLGQLFTGRGE